MAYGIILRHCATLQGAQDLYVPDEVDRFFPAMIDKFVVTGGDEGVHEIKRVMTVHPINSFFLYPSTITGIHTPLLTVVKKTVVWDFKHAPKGAETLVQVFL